MEGVCIVVIPFFKFLFLNLTDKVWRKYASNRLKCAKIQVNTLVFEFLANYRPTFF